MTVAYVGLGANLGGREETLRRAVELLGEADGVDVLAVSQLRETEPVGFVDQPRFLNGAVAVVTTRTPRELLDLLVYGDEVVDQPGLRVPHPRLHERRFALEPLAELDPELDIPGLGRVAARLAALD